MYEVLAGPDGAKFRDECKAAGKGLCCWTVNTKAEMRECVRWGIGSVISDKPELWRELKKEVRQNSRLREPQLIRLQILADKARALKPTFAGYVLPFLQVKNYKLYYVSRLDWPLLIPIPF
jgi:phosphatidylglycerol phospholipase C